MYSQNKELWIIHISLMDNPCKKKNSCATITPTRNEAEVSNINQKQEEKNMNMKKMLTMALAGTMALGMLPATVSAEETTEWEYKEAELTLLVDNASSLDGLNAVAELAKEKLGITLSIETRPGGEEGMNIVKTRLASGDMADLCVYNSGSVMAALNPADYFLDLTEESFAENLDDTFKSAVTVDGKVYGIPFSSSSSGAVLYNKKVYEEYNLEVPKTWEEFLANCDILKEAGETALIGTFADTWTSQVPVLGDFYNVQAGAPTFAKDFEEGKAKYATTPSALASWQKLADTVQYYSIDYLATTYDDGCDLLATGEGAQWIILSGALPNIAALYPEEINDIGLFAIPGDDAENNGLTVWMPSGIYANKNSEKIDDIKRFMEFYISDEALDAYAAVQVPDGPYCVKGYELPEDVYPAVKDAQAYFDAGLTSTAMEFQCGVSSSSGGAICTECATGQTTAEESAHAWDEDCRKQAMQLGFDWE